MQKRDPKAIWAWIFLLYFLPVPGMILCIILCQNYRGKKIFQEMVLTEEEKGQLASQQKELRTPAFWKRYSRCLKYEDLIGYNLQTANALFRQHNEVKVYTDGRQKFQAMSQEIEKAKHTVYIESYILRDDGAFSMLEKALRRAMENGARVQILYDGMGGIGMRKRQRQRFREMGLETAVFFGPFFRILQLRLNYRNHRKIVVIDGKVAFVGGFNIGKEYVIKTRKYGYWRDTHLKITGDAVQDLERRFLTDWECAVRKRKKYFKEASTKQDKENRAGLNDTSRNQTNVGIQIISSGPDTKEPYIRDNFLRMFYTAKDHIYIQTPYFIPDDAIISALKNAVLSGVTVKLMVPCMSDHIGVFWATRAYAKEIIDAGVECYCYLDGFIHAKGVMIDGELSCYGTANMDYRSFWLNFEVNAVLYDEKITKQLEEIFLADVERCSRLTMEDYENATVWIRIKESLARLMGPVL